MAQLTGGHPSSNALPTHVMPCHVMCCNADSRATSTRTHAPVAVAGVQRVVGERQRGNNVVQLYVFRAQLLGGEGGLQQVAGAVARGHER